MPLWYPAQAASPVAITPSLRRRRHHYRHQIQSLAYLNLDQSNGGIIRNLGGAGIAVQAVAPLNIDQRVFLRFDLANPRIRIEGTGRVAWADPTGQAGIEFLALSQRCRRGLKEWIFIQLLTAAQATADLNFLYTGDTEELLFSRVSRPAIRFETSYRTVALAIEKDQRTRPFELPWFPFAVSAQALSHVVDVLILLSAVLLFAVICIAMIGVVPSWPIVLMLGLGVSGVFAVLYRFLFLFWIGGTPGDFLAGLTNDTLAHLEDDRPRFR
jgi:PilZ domain